MADSEYSAADVEIVRDLDHIRKRPSMYIGSTDLRGLHGLAEEVCGSLFAEFQAGFLKWIEIDLLPDGGLCVRSDGRGIPADLIPSAQARNISLPLNLFGSQQCDSSTAPYAAGLQGIGLKAANALSRRLLAEVCRDGRRWQVEFHAGKLSGEATCTPDPVPAGTSLTFWPDPAIFPDTTFSFDDLAEWLDAQAALLPGLRVRLCDQRVTPAQSLAPSHPSGVAGLLRNRITGERLRHRDLCSVQAREENLRLDLAVGWVQSDTVRIWSYVNTIPTTMGSHVQGLLNGVARVLLPRMRARGQLRPIVEDIRAGLRGVISVWHPDPWWGSPTRDRLGNPEVAGFVERHLGGALEGFFATHPTDGAVILACADAARLNRLVDPQTGKTPGSSPRRQRQN